jgi:hypothetical protein
MRLHNSHFVYTFLSIFCTFLPFLYGRNYDSFISHVTIWIYDFSLRSSYPAYGSPLLVIAFLFLLVILFLCFNLLLGLGRVVCPVCFVYPRRFCSVRNMHCHEGASLSYSVATFMKNSTSTYSRLFFSPRSSSLLHYYMQRKILLYMLRT